MTTTPNPLYVMCPSLQNYFVDKDTGLPLAGGQVNFFSDTNRTMRKAIYEISGNPPNYTFTQLDNPLFLSGVGTFVDSNGADITVYLYPFDQFGNTELYYVTVLDSQGIPQFSRQAWPPFEFTNNEENTNEIDQENFVPNGQFVAHFIVPPTSTTTTGTITQPITNIAPGGWTFERPVGSGATDIVTFDRFGSYVEFPTGSPRYEVQVQCTSAFMTDAFKYLAVKFIDVNKFASDTQQYTFFFEALSLSGNIDIQIVIVKNFGTGGIPSSPVVIPVDTLTIENSRQNYSVDINFGTNTNFTIGTNDDDYVQIALALPPDNTYNLSFTDFVLFEGVLTVTQFPVTTTADFLSKGIAGWMPIPNPNGSQIGLPLVLTQSGLTFDNSEVGNVYLTSSPVVPPQYLLANGSQYLTAGYSSIGIPYSRLQSVYFNTSFNLPLYGTGIPFLTCYIQDGVPGTIRLVTNQPGVQPLTTGVIVPFSFVNTHIGQTALGVNAFASNFNLVAQIYFRGIEVGAVNAVTSGTMASFSSILFQNNVQTVQQFLINPGFSGGATASTYFTYSAIVSSILTNFYVWFTVNGAGSDPTPGGTGIQVNTLSNYTTNELNYVVKDAMNGYQITHIALTSGNLITQGSYFTVYANSQPYVVWFMVNGVGIQPSVASAIYIPVNVLTTDTAANVATKVQIAINSFYFAVPDLRNDFIRIFNDTTTLGNADLRVSALSNIAFATTLGSFEDYMIQSHTHTGTVNVRNVAATTPSGSNVVGGTTTTFPLDINLTGGNETRPLNTYLNALIKY